MRILHIQKVNGIGGSERHLLSLLPALSARGLEVEIGVLGGADASVFVKALADAGVDAFVLPSAGDLNPRLIPALVGHMRRHKPDLVHTHLVHADVYGQASARLLGIPAVSTVHSAAGHYRKEPSRTGARMAGRLARKTIAISEHVASFVRDSRLAPPDRVVVVHYGIDTAGWKVLPGDRTRLRRELDVGETEVAVGVASRLVPYKGHDDLLAAMDVALTAAPNLRLLVAGTGPLRESLQLMAGRTAHPEAIRFLGFVPDVGAFMQACDIFAFPTAPAFGEGFGLAALEAMAARRPVVATAVGPIPEVVVDGQTGLLVPPRSPRQLGEAIARLAADPRLRERLGEAAGERAETVFGLDRMVGRTIDVYGSVL